MSKTKLAVKDKIANVLMQHSEDSFLSIEQIASLAYEGAYLKETKKHLNGLVKRNMPHAIALLSEMNIIVIKDLEPTLNGKKLSYKGVNGYKVADEEDKEVLSRNLISKKQRLEISQQMLFDFAGLAGDSNLISSDELLKLNG